MFVFCHHFHECKQAEFCVHSQLVCMWLIAHVCMWLVVKIMLDIKYISDATQWILTKFPPIWGLGGPQSSLTDPKVILTRWIAIYPNNLKVALLANIRNKPEFSRLFTLLYILGIFWESFSPPIIEIWIKILLTLNENIQKKSWKDNKNVTLNSFEQWIMKYGYC